MQAISGITISIAIACACGSSGRSAGCLVPDCWSTSCWMQHGPTALGGCPSGWMCACSLCLLFSCCRVRCRRWSADRCHRRRSAAWRGLFDSGRSQIDASVGWPGFSWRSYYLRVAYCSSTSARPRKCWASAVCAHGPSCSGRSYCSQLKAYCHHWLSWYLLCRPPSGWRFLGATDYS